jgi:[acyl-carrier-protein] S-malonyltransferase
VLQKTLFVKPAIDLVNNVDVRVETRPDDIRHALVRQAYSPVRWMEIVKKMQASGVTHIMECGPGKVLAGLTKRIAPDVQSFSLADKASLEAALKC